MSKRTEDLTGKRFGKLVVTNMIYGDGKTKCECVCDCGNSAVVVAYRLKSGNKTSCGCDSHERSAAKKRKDLTGQRFGKLVVKEMIYGEVVGGKKRTQCVCECDCGNIVTVVADRLTSGRKISCGCDTIERRVSKLRKDLTGQKFGRLTVLKMLWDEKPTKCVCLCDCGNETIVAGADLSIGHTQSCGCLQRERTSKANEKDFTGVTTPSGIKFIKRYKQDDHGVWIWVCKCGICGNYFTAIPARVTNEHIKSCGCSKRSYGEIMVQNILDKLNIKYETEYTFPDCVNSYVLRFDFAVFDEFNNLQFLIEYDGAQHYIPVSLFGGEDGFRKRKENDNIKNEYCDKNNIDLLRLPYYLSDEEVFNIIEDKYKQISKIRRDCNGLHGNVQTSATPPPTLM